MSFLRFVEICFGEILKTWEFSLEPEFWRISVRSLEFPRVAENHRDHCPSKSWTTFVISLKFMRVQENTSLIMTIVMMITTRMMMMRTIMTMLMMMRTLMTGDNKVLRAQRVRRQMMESVASRWAATLFEQCNPFTL